MGETSNNFKPLDLTYRVLINGLGATLLAIFIYLASLPSFRWAFALAVGAIAAIALWEYYQFLKKKELFPATILGIVAIILYVWAIFFKTQGPFWGSISFRAPEIILGLTFFGCFIHFASVGKPPIVNISTTFFGIIYIGVPLGLFVRMMFFFTFNGMEDLSFQGGWWIIYLLVVTKSGDMGGYFIGRYFGRRKIAFKFSPNKTLEGAFGCLFASIVMSWLVCFLGKKWGGVFSEFSYVQSLWLGVAIGVFGQVGDLAESFLKRDVDVKDSNTIPGVGGILDMVDSLLFTAPIVYIFLRILYSKQF